MEKRIHNYHAIPGIFNVTSTVDIGIGILVSLKLGQPHIPDFQSHSSSSISGQEHAPKNEGSCAGPR